MSETTDPSEEPAQSALNMSMNLDYTQHIHYNENQSSMFRQQFEFLSEPSTTTSKTVDMSGQSEEITKLTKPTTETEPLESSKEIDVKLSYCRFCATKIDCRELLDLSTEDIIGKYQKLLLYLKLDVDFSTNNPLPKYACSSCHNTCLETYRFFLKVGKAQEDLNALYGKSGMVLKDLEGSGNKGAPMEIDVIQKMVIGKGIIKTELEECFEEPRADESASDTEPQYTDMDSIAAPTTSNKQATLKPKNETETQTKLPKKTTYKVKKTIVKSPKKKSETNVKNVTFSWASYLWSCDHCKAEYNTMDELRLHSRYTHNCCYGFSCVDCNDEFNTFNAFVEHVRSHREYLRFFCQYCNRKFRNKEECAAHALTHWDNGQKICEYCGEIFPDHDTLRQHKSSGRPKPLSHNTRRKRPRQVEDKLSSWNDYRWTCQDCYQTMPNVHTLRIHVREVHYKCFAMKCLDCLRVHRSHGDLVKHIHGHRPNLKRYCHYCNQYFENPDEMDNHIEEHYSGLRKPCYGCGEIFENDELLRKHIFDYGAMRRPGPHSEEEVTCDICSKNCLTVGKLKIHRKIHEYKERCYVCDTCGNSYFNFWTYQSHIKIHGERSEICKICKKGFPTKVKLKNHAKTHLVDRPFACDQCGSAFKTKNKLTRHKMIHTDAKPYVCVICDKSFRQKNGLKNHAAQHTGVRPYQCEFCDRTFTNNPNRDKHMRRRHGVPLYKAKEVPQEVTDSKAKEWLSQVTANQKKKKDNSDMQASNSMML